MSKDEELSAEEREIVEAIASRVVDLRMSVPAVVFLEATAPLGFLASQAMLFLKPVLEPFWFAGDYSKLQNMLERREAIQSLVSAIEDAEKTHRISRIR
ncbi:MAG: hypothetical protein GXP49_16110 [Deltaproteobacteria bacterium]|nr:hypothetical protein [Deltaproteobacteria bacterium]